MFHILIFLRNWGVEGAMCKHLEFLDQHPQRNDLSKLATFDPILQRPHSALVKVKTSKVTFEPNHATLHVSAKDSPGNITLLILIEKKTKKN